MNTRAARLGTLLDVADVSTGLRVAAVLFALVCSGVAIAYGIGLTAWLLRQPAGSERMQEIAHAVQEGAAAYLRRQ